LAFGKSSPLGKEMRLQPDRKGKERELHDMLRGDRSNHPYYTSNRKFYSISQINGEYVKKWLSARCKGKKVLDYCCGDGDFTIWMAETGAYAFGIDISPVSIQNAAETASCRGLGDRAIFRVMDAEDTEFANEYFDLIVINGVLHHLDLEKAYRELARILSPKGEIICTEALRHNPVIHLYRKKTPHLRSAWETEHILGRREIEKARSHFHEVKILRFFHLATIAAVPLRNLAMFFLLRTVLAKIDSILLKIPLIKWQAWMVVFVLSDARKSAAN
jgi:ubiquinone/menaquinone biosynthesis C-methylase UbiE